jgi:hypothetical protein
VEGVLYLLRWGEGLEWRGGPEKFSISIKIKCANGNFIKNKNYNTLNKIYSKLIKIYCLS